MLNRRTVIQASLGGGLVAVLAVAVGLAIETVATLAVAGLGIARLDIALAIAALAVPALAAVPPEAKRPSSQFRTVARSADSAKPADSG